MKISSTRGSSPQLLVRGRSLLLLSWERSAIVPVGKALMTNIMRVEVCIIRLAIMRTARRPKIHLLFPEFINFR